MSFSSHNSTAQQAALSLFPRWWTLASTMATPTLLVCTLFSNLLCPLHRISPCIERQDQGCPCLLRRNAVEVRRGAHPSRRTLKIEFATSAASLFAHSACLAYTTFVTHLPSVASVTCYPTGMWIVVLAAITKVEPFLLLYGVLSLLSVTVKAATCAQALFSVTLVYDTTIEQIGRAHV